MFLFSLLFPCGRRGATGNRACQVFEDGRHEGPWWRFPFLQDSDRVWERAAIILWRSSDVMWDAGVMQQKINWELGLDGRQMLNFKKCKVHRIGELKISRESKFLEWHKCTYFYFLLFAEQKLLPGCPADPLRVSWNCHAEGTWNRAGVD